MTAFSPLIYNPDTQAREAAALLPRLSDPDPVVRRIALLDIADLEDETLLPAISHALGHDTSIKVRSEAAHVLAAWEQPEVVAALCKALLDQDSEVRHAAAQSLAELKQLESGPILLQWATHAEPFVQTSVFRALRELRFAGAFDSALRALDHSQAAVRLEAIGVLGWLKDARALAALATLAWHDTEFAIRRAAVGALGFAAAPDDFVVQALLNALHDDAWQVREEAAATLGKLHTAIAGKALIAALRDDYWQVRLQAARALGKRRDAQASVALAELLTHTISNLRKEAALALGELGQLGDPRVQAALHKALADRDPEVRKAVRIALQQIEERVE